MSSIRTTCPSCLQMHHQGRVQSHCITPSAQGFTMSPNYMKLQSSEWVLPSGRQLDQQYLGHRGTEKAKQYCLVSMRINTAPPIPHPLYSKCHSKHVTDLPQKSPLSWAESFCKISSSSLTGYQAESSYGMCSYYESRARSEIPQKKQQQEWI